MGVPKFCSWLKNNQKFYNIYFNKNYFPTSLSEDLSDTKLNEITKNNKKVNTKLEFDYLFFDANSIIYDIYYELEDKEFINIEEYLIDNTIKYLDKHINKVNAKNTYIAFDGIPPFSKITQQRIRRYTSYYQNEGKEFWPPNCHISPGTNFMKKLNTAIIEYIKNNKRKIIYSSYENVGEGEHKIIQYIKKYCKNNKILIYGGDTDMIFLSLIQILKNNNQIYIYNHINNVDNYYNVNLIKTLLMKILKSYSSSLTETNIYDFIVICFIIGNDFLHNIPFYNIYNIDDLILSYVHSLDYYNEKKYLLYEDEDNIIRIDNYNLLQLIKELKEKELLIFKQEDKLMSSNYTIEFLEKIKGHKHCTFNKVEELRLKQKDYNYFDNIDLTDKTDNEIFDIMITYKYNYYNYYLKTNNLKIINDMCSSYLYGIYWNIDYYFNSELINDLSANCPDWQWCYKYHCSPFITDLLNYLEKSYETLEFTSIENQPLTINQQLFYIIPDKYLEKINKNLYNIIQQHKYLIPKTIKYDTIHKVNIHECPAIVPLYNYVVIKNIIK